MQCIKNIPVIGSNGRVMGMDIFYKETDGKCPVVIYVHGFNGFKDWANFDLIAMEFAQAGFFFVKMNLSHNGTSLNQPEDFVDLEAFGNNNYSKELFDVGEIIEWICNEKNPYQAFINATQITLIGHSRGGGIAILKASQDSRIQSLITWASVSECKTPWGNMSANKLAAWKESGAIYYTNKRTQQKLPLYYQLFEDYLLHEKQLNIQAAIASLKIPVLICHGTNDEAVPFESAKKLSDWNQQAQLFSVNSDHVFGRKHPNTENTIPVPMKEVIQESIKFLKLNGK